MNSWTRKLAIPAISAAAMLTFAGPVLAGPVLAVPDPTAVLCPVGNVCLATQSGPAIVRIPSGESRTFAPPLKITAVANATKLDYCVIGNANFGIRAGATVERQVAVSAVAPGTICPL
jgi:hypothetical protein